MSGQGAGFRTIETADVAGKRVLVRADLNVPAKSGKVTDATRLERIVPPSCRPSAGKVVLMSHFGRPGEPKPEYNSPVRQAGRTARRDESISQTASVSGRGMRQTGQNGDGQLENLRFYLAKRRTARLSPSR
jgi:phosphoglycerate kinase